MDNINIKYDEHEEHEEYKEYKENINKESSIRIEDVIKQIDKLLEQAMEIMEIVKYNDLLLDNIEK